MEIPPLAHMQDHLGFAAHNEHQSSNLHSGVSCPLPVESLLAAEVAEAGVPQSCRKIPLFSSTQVREDRTSLLFIIMFNKHLLTG